VNCVLFIDVHWVIQIQSVLIMSLILHTAVFSPICELDAIHGMYSTSKCFGPVFYT
jgi:hypothetical protein